MRGVNLIAVFDESADRVLMCKRRKDPYKGLLNFVGGKIEKDEDGLLAAYRELYEETGITREEITLKHMMDFTYYFQSFYMEVYVGRLKGEKCVFGEENELIWVDVNECFSDISRFAGMGNLEHIMNVLKNYKKEEKDVSGIGEEK